MLHKTKAIVLYAVKYNDNCSIAHIYTEKFGINSYWIKKDRKKISSIHPFFYPFSVLELEVDHRNLREIQQIKEVKIHFPCFSIHNNPLKSTISFFLVEFFGKIILNKQPDNTLFMYLFQSIQILELIENNYSNFHLVFMIKLSYFLGFYPNHHLYNKGMYFDLMNGVFVPKKPNHFSFLDQNESSILVKLLRMNYKNMSSFTLTRNERNYIIRKILNYYRLHLGNFFKIKSLEVLREIFD